MLTIWSVKLFEKDSGGMLEALITFGPPLLSICAFLVTLWLKVHSRVMRQRNWYGRANADDNIVQMMSGMMGV